MTSPLHLTDLQPDVSDLTASVAEGVAASQKTLPTAFLYDEHGSELFEQICELPEYYPTRTELSIYDTSLGEMSKAIGPEAMVIEYGSGAGVKTLRLLEALDRPVAYVPVEISEEHLMRSAEQLNARFPDLEVLPVCADFTAPMELPSPSTSPRRRVLFFPGSTIGNFTRNTAVRLLRQMRENVGSGGGALMGVDLRKDIAVLEAAYNDARGVTAQFNLNLLHRANEELGANFNLGAFEHRAVWVEARGAIEMRLYARTAQIVKLAGRSFTFAEGEWIHTEDSHKYSLEDFAAMADSAGFNVEKVWTDPKQLFSVQYLTAR